MKKETLMDAINNIDPDIIEKSVNYRPKVLRRNVTRIAALAACLAILVTSVPLALVMNRENKVQTPDFLQTQPSENNGGDDVVIDDTSAVKVIYCSSSIKEELIDKYKGQDVEIRDSAEIEISGEEKEVDPSTIEGIPARLYLTVEGKELVCTFNGKVRLLWGDETKPGIYRAMYSIDNVDNDQAYLFYSVSTHEVITLSLMESRVISDINKEHKINEEIAHELSDKILVELFGQDALDLYNFSNSKVITDRSGGVKQYETYYSAYVNGYKTSQGVIIGHDIEGSLISVIVTCPTKIDVLKNLDCNTVQEAKEKSEHIFDEVTEGMTLQSVYINVQRDDKAYWCYLYSGLNEFGEVKDYEFFYPIG